MTEEEKQQRADEYTPESFNEQMVKTFLSVFELYSVFNRFSNEKKLAVANFRAEDGRRTIDTVYAFDPYARGLFRSFLPFPLM
jgi:hypothetical protein